MSEWISVKDRVPEPLQRVLVFSEKGKFYIDFSLYSTGKFLLDGVTHWMPLPEPPSEEQPQIVKVETILKKFDKVETIEGCTVQILTDTETGEQSVGWWRGSAEDMPEIRKEANE